MRHMIILNYSLPRPFSGRGLVPGSVSLVKVSNIRNERIIRVGVGQHRADRKEHYQTISTSRWTEVRKAPHPSISSMPETIGPSEYRDRWNRLH